MSRKILVKSQIKYLVHFKNSALQRNLYNIVSKIHNKSFNFLLQEPQILKMVNLSCHVCVNRV